MSCLLRAATARLRALQLILCCAALQAATWAMGLDTALRCAPAGSAAACLSRLQGAEHTGVQLWKRYLPNTKVSFLEYDAACATKHKANIEAQSKGTLYIGELVP